VQKRNLSEINTVKWAVMKNALAEATKSIRNAMEINGITVQQKLNSLKLVIKR
tara:strand:- start:134 stop:292 length:159 start_codon:yes stop_codon:yes gene_type:complete